jgi:putative FmdB family regulatory protein
VPIYAYRQKDDAHGCPHCKETFEVRQSMADDRLQLCPQCGGPVQVIISTVSYVHGHNIGDGLTRERLKHGGFRKLVKGDDGLYVDDTPK